MSEWWSPGGTGGGNGSVPAAQAESAVGRRFLRTCSRVTERHECNAKDQSNREVTVQGDFSHMDDMGNVRMVDVSGKPVSKRRAAASGAVRMSASTVEKLREGSLRKGDALGSARIAGIMAAKRTSELIPLCHPLPIDDIDVRLSLEAERVVIEAAAVSTARTGVEMEALTAVAVAALTVYDMCKAVDRGMVIDGIELVSKTKEEV